MLLGLGYRVESFCSNTGVWFGGINSDNADCRVFVLFIMRNLYEKFERTFSEYICCWTSCSTKHMTDMCGVWLSVCE